MNKLFTMKKSDKFDKLVEAAQAKLGVTSKADAINTALWAIVDEKQVIFHCKEHNFGTAMTLAAHEHWLRHQAEKQSTTPAQPQPAGE